MDKGEDGNDIKKEDEVRDNVQVAKDKFISKALALEQLRALKVMPAALI